MAATNSAVPGAALQVEAPRLGFRWSKAVGVVDRVCHQPLTPRYAVRLASNTKTFVAVAILRLWEQDKLNLDAPVVNYLSSASVAILKAGGYQPERITVRHLLTHTSGVYDFAQSDQVNKLWESNPAHFWTRAEQLSFAMSDGKPYGAPGRVYEYSDTGYILLGEMLEQITGQTMAAALRELVGYRKLGLNSTWLESVEPKPAAVPDRAHQYDRERDTYNDDPSADLYGGGGLVSTMGDLATFMRAIFTGRIYKKIGTADTMLTTVPGTIAGPPSYGIPQIPGVYRMGIEVRQRAGVITYSHGGYWGTMAIYIPSLDAAFALSINQQKAWHQIGPVCNEVVRLLVEASQAEK